MATHILLFLTNFISLDILSATCYPTGRAYSPFNKHLLPKCDTNFIYLDIMSSYDQLRKKTCDVGPIVEWHFTGYLLP